MKKILVNISLAMLAVGGMTSCSDILDKEVDLTYTDENIYSNYDRTRGVLANAYTYLPDAFAGYTDGQFRAASRDCMTDNAISYWNVHYYHSVLNDSYDAKNHWFAENYWSNDLKGIRVCNDFISKARESVIGNAEKSGDDNKLCDRYKAEARFIRAILHFDMIGYFGAVPIEDHVLDNAEAASIARTPAPEALKWVADECDAIIKSGALPFRYSNENENWGRINGAAVYALKSRALLYRASALNNPTNDGKLLGVEDVVYFLILQKSVCVDSRARYVEIASDERGARRYLVADLMLKVFGDLRYDGQIHAAVVSAQRAVFHDHRFKRAVSGSLADPEQ